MRIGGTKLEWEQKLSNWRAYESRLDDILKTTPGMDPQDRVLLTRYKDRIHKGIKIKSACRVMEKTGFVAAQVGACAIIPILLIGAPPLAIATAGALFGGMGLITGSIIWNSKHPDQMVGGVPDTKTMDAVARNVTRYMHEKTRQEEAARQLQEKAKEFGDDMRRLAMPRNFLPGVEIVDGQVIVGGVRLQRNPEKQWDARKPPGSA
jgi:hypothetical protein